MSKQRSDEKPTSAPKPESKPKQPPSTELSPKELDEAAGGVSDIHFTKLIDKSSPQL
jgi:type VI protein secretion system component Hcp